MELPVVPSLKKRVVIVGAGFAGLTLAKKLSSKYFQVVLLDKNNYHQFQPLLYQVATAGLEPSAISFPLRKIFQDREHVFIRIAEVKSVNTAGNSISTSVGDLRYDYLVLAGGAETNYFGMDELQRNCFSMKSVSEALLLRNTLLQNYERALSCKSEEERSALLNVVIVGGGPTGVELAGAISEMKNKILPRDYPELNFKQMNVWLVEAAPRLLNGMSEASAKNVQQYLERLGVQILNSTSVKNYDGHRVSLDNGNSLPSRCLIWAAGVKGTELEGLPDASIHPNKRILVDDFNRIQGLQNVFAIGDVALMKTNKYPGGHPQVAPVAMQQAVLLAKNLVKTELEKNLKSFQYKNKGSMATVGRNLAVAELGAIKMKGFMAWMVWMLVHLLSIIGIKNRVLILVNWTWQYFTYDQSLRLIIRPSEDRQPMPGEKKQNLQHKKIAELHL